MNLIIIAAIGKNNELGINNQLLWHLPGDLQFFKEKTLDKTIVMGRKTFESLPGILPKRKHIVLTNQQLSIDGVETINSIDEFLKKYYNLEGDIYIIGGGQIYNSFINHCNLMYLTKVDSTFNADTFFPDFNEDDWYIKELDEKEENGLKYKHYEYIRRR